MTTPLLSCPRCSTRWRHRESVGHCSECHRTFIGEQAFDLHRVTATGGDRICRDVGAATSQRTGAPLFEAVDPSTHVGTGDFWRQYTTPEAKARLAALNQQRNGGQ